MIQLGEISKAEAARYMGIRTAPDDMTAELLDRYEKSSAKGCVLLTLTARRS